MAEARDAVAHAIGAKDPAFLDVEWEQIERILDGVVVQEHETQRRHAAEGIAVEHVIETDLEGTFGTVALTGRPDRVELHRRDGALIELRVLDYKVSRQRQKYGKLVREQLGRTSLQIPVYLLVALAHVGEAGRNAKLSGGYVLAREIPANQIVPCEITPARLGTGAPEAGESVLDHLAILVGRARAGHFHVDPEPCDPYCAFRGVCRYQEPPLEEDEVDDA